MARWQCNMIELCQWPPTLAPAGTKHSSTTSSTSLISCQPLCQHISQHHYLHPCLSPGLPLYQPVDRANMLGPVLISGIFTLILGVFMHIFGAEK